MSKKVFKRVLLTLVLASSTMQYSFAQDIEDWLFDALEESESTTPKQATKVTEANSLNSQAQEQDFNESDESSNKESSNKESSNEMTPIEQTNKDIDQNVEQSQSQSQSQGQQTKGEQTVNDSNNQSVNNGVVEGGDSTIYEQQDELENVQSNKNETPSEQLDEVYVYSPAVQADTEIGADQFSKKPPSTLAEIFDSTPGVDVGGGELPMAQKIFIRGMDDIMLNVAVDGAVKNGEIFHHQARVAINPDILEKVEVNAGVSSSLNGPGGLGGSVNFVTKSPFDLTDDQKTFGGSLKLGYNSVNKGRQSNLNAYGVVSDKVGYLVTLTNNQADEYKDGNGEKALYTDYNQWDVFAKVDTIISDTQGLVISVNHLSDNGFRSLKPQFSEHLVKWQTKAGQQEFSTDSVTSKYSFNPTDEDINLELTASYSQSTLIQKPEGLLEIGGKNETYSIDLRNSYSDYKNSLVYGFDFNKNISATLNEGEYEKWAQQALELDPNLIGVPEKVKSDDAQVFGLFVQNNYQLNEKVEFDFGARVDSYSLNDNLDNGHGVIAVSPNATVLIKPNEDLEVYYSRAYVVRGVGAKESLLIDYAGQTPPSYILEASNVNFTNVYDEDIKEEKAHLFEVGTNYTFNDFFTKFNFFSTRIENFINYSHSVFASYEDGTTSDTIIYNYNTNIGTARMSGFEWMAGYQIENFKIKASVADSIGTLTYEDGESRALNDGDYGLGTSVGLSYNIAMDYEFPDINLAIGYNIKGAAEESYESVEYANTEFEATKVIVKEAYMVRDLYVSWSPNQIENLDLVLNIDNESNERYFSHATYAEGGIAEAGMNIGLTASYSF